MQPDEVLIERLGALKESVDKLHAKLDPVLKQTTENTTDISWLKKGQFGTIFTYLGALAYIKFSG